jgi:hypothetical protein
MRHLLVGLSNGSTISPRDLRTMLSRRAYGLDECLVLEMSAAEEGHHPQLNKRAEYLAIIMMRKWGWYFPSTYYLGITGQKRDIGWSEMLAVVTQDGDLATLRQLNPSYVVGSQALHSLMEELTTLLRPANPAKEPEIARKFRAR